MTQRIWVALALGMAIAGPSLGGEVPATSRVVAVTVFPTLARVTREARVELAAGVHTLVFAGLPPGLDSDSLSLAGVSGGAVELGALESRREVVRDFTTSQEQELVAKLQELRDQVRQAQDRGKALQLRYEFIERLGKTATALIDKEIAEYRIEPETWRAAWDAVGSGAADTLQAMQTGEVRQRELNEEIRVVQGQLNQIRTGQRETLSVLATVTSGGAGGATFRLSYQVPGASWRPAYEARLDAEARSLDLGQFAWVQQRTGEDWEGVALTLSTARPARGNRLPQLHPWVVDLAVPVPMGALSSAPARGKVMSESRERMFGAAEPSAPFLDRAEDIAVERTLAQVEGGEFATEMRVPGVVSVPADNQAHQFATQSRTLDVSLEAQSVPRLRPVAYLVARGAVLGDHALLPGRVALFWKDAFVGRAELPLLRSGEEVELSFGIDDAVKVEYVREPETKGESGIFGRRKRREYRYKITVTNHHDTELRMRVRDQLPVPAHEDISVDLSDPTTPPDGRDVADVKGALEWSWPARPGEVKELQLRYRVSWPADQEVSGL